MPCYDGRDSSEILREEAERFAKLANHSEKIEAALCAILTKLEKDNLFATVMNDVDWKEAGISQRFVDTWWVNHKAYDEQRRHLEEEVRLRNAEKEERKRRKQEVLAKLTPEERKILGV